MIFGIRHGARADQDIEEFKKVKLSFDPQLSTEGIKQSIETGKFLQSQIELYQNKLIAQNQLDEDQPLQTLIISSPFLRCLQTASYIAQSIENNYKNTIFVQQELCEHLSLEIFQKNPMGHLMLSQGLKNVQKFLSQDQKYSFEESLLKLKQNLVPQFPEKNVAKRAKQVIKQLIEQFVGNFDTKKYVLLFITHYVLVEEAVLIFSKKKLINQKEIDNCGIFQLEFEDCEKFGFEQYQVHIDGNNNHLDF